MKPQNRVLTFNEKGAPINSRWFGDTEKHNRERGGHGLYLIKKL